MKRFGKIPLLQLTNIYAIKGKFEICISDIEIQESEFVVIVGPSGCGKTTLLEIISGITPVKNGVVKLNGHDITQLPPYKRNLHTCWQVGGETLFPHLSVGENAGFGLRVKGVDGISRKERVMSLLDSFGLSETYDRRISQLSGGQKQRVAIVRTLAPMAPLILLDEVVTGLDPDLRDDLRNKLIKIKDDMNVTILYVSHDLDEAEKLSRETQGRMLVMDSGMVMQFSKWDNIYNYPTSRFIAQYLGPINLFEGSIIDETKFIVKGLGELPLREGHEVNEWHWYGIRPEKIRIGDSDSQDKMISGKITKLDPDRGAQNIIIKSGIYEILVRDWAIPDKYFVGDTVSLSWDYKDIILLD